MLTLRNDLLRHFGLQQTGEHTSPVLEMFETELRESILAREMMAVIAPPGAGKTHLLSRVKRSLEGTDQAPSWVHVRDMTPRRTRLQNVLNAIVRDLSDNESLRHDLENRSRQVDRLLGTQMAAGHPACVVIEDAHRLHPDSLSALKLLREAEFNGVAPTHSVVLLGWPSLRRLLSRHDEIRWRTDQLVMSEKEGYMRPPERADYLENVFGPALSDEVRRTIAQQCQVPAEMNARVKDAMREARNLGYDVVDDRTVSPRMHEMKEAMGLSQKEIGQEADLSKSTVHRVLKDEKKGRENKHTDDVQKAIDRIKRRRSEGASENAPDSESEERAEGETLETVGGETLRAAPTS